MHRFALVMAVVMLAAVLYPVLSEVLRKRLREWRVHRGQVCHWYANFDAELQYEPHHAQDIVRVTRSEMERGGYAPSDDVRIVPRTFRGRIPGDRHLRLWISRDRDSPPMWLCVSPAIVERMIRPLEREDREASAAAGAAIRKAAAVRETGSRSAKSPSFGPWPIAAVDPNTQMPETARALVEPWVSAPGGGAAVGPELAEVGNAPIESGGGEREQNEPPEAVAGAEADGAGPAAEEASQEPSAAVIEIKPAEPEETVEAATQEGERRRRRRRRSKRLGPF